jgi:hypothetical protein
MTTDRPLPTGRRLTLASLALLLTAAALGSAAACGDDDEPNNFIGVTDAEPPRLGERSDAGPPR